jgi:hypothetical protein
MCDESSWKERVSELEAELERFKVKYKVLKGHFNHTVEIAGRHCPTPLGRSLLFDGIPLLAERAGKAEGEVERARAMLKELFVWADNWLPDEAKDQGARDVLKNVRAFLEEAP